MCKGRAKKGGPDSLTIIKQKQILMGVDLDGLKASIHLKILRGNQRTEDILCKGYGYMYACVQEGDYLI